MMVRVCVLQYGGIFIAALFGSGIGTFLVARFWKAGEFNGNGRDLKQK